MRSIVLVILVLAPGLLPGCSARTAPPPSSPTGRRDAAVLGEAAPEPEMPAWARACDLAGQEGPSAEADPVAAVARRYYPIARRELWCPGEEDGAGSLRGMVIDRRGRPVPGAEVVLGGRGEEEVVARVESDEAGLFELPRPASGASISSVTVSAEAFSRHAYAVGSWQGVYVARLDRAVTASLIDEILETTDEGERLWGLLELVGPRTIDEPSEALLFPRLGDLRPHLRALVDSGLFDEPDDRGVSPSQRATRLLAYWHDDADRELVDRWVEASRYASRPGRPVSAEALDGVCGAFADLHFEREGVSGPRTMHGCSEPILDPEERHGCVTFNVRYAHWGYSIILILRRPAERWQVELEIEGVRYHMDP